MAPPCQRICNRSSFGSPLLVTVISRRSANGACACGHAAALGTSVALARDGNTMMMGGYRDRDFVGAAWVFTRSGDTWTQQGNKLVGVGIGRGYQGFSVSLSGDRQHRHRGRPHRQQHSGRGVDLRPQVRRLVRASATSSSVPARWDRPDRAWRSPCPPAATPRSWAGGSTMAASGRRGLSRRRVRHRAGNKRAPAQPPKMRPLALLAPTPQDIDICRHMDRIGGGSRWRLEASRRIEQEISPREA